MRQTLSHGGSCDTNERNSQLLQYFDWSQHGNPNHKIYFRLDPLKKK